MTEGWLMFWEGFAGGTWPRWLGWMSGFIVLAVIRDLSLGFLAWWWAS